MSDNWTAEQIVAAMEAALKARDMPAVASLLRLLAVRAPDQAQVIYDAITKRTVAVGIPLGALAESSSSVGVFGARGGHEEEQR